MKLNGYQGVIRPRAGALYGADDGFDRFVLPDNALLYALLEQ